MKSRRTISYIGLWALIMPWLGFSWETKTVLFSLTGIVLLFIGNRYYHAEKKLKIPNSPIDENPVKKEEPVILAQSIKTYDDVPDYMEPVKQASPVSPQKKFDENRFNNFSQNFTDLKPASESVSGDLESSKEIILEPQADMVFEKPEPRIEYADQNIVSSEPVIKTKQSKVKRSIEILPRLRRSKKAISLESLDTNE